MYILSNTLYDIKKAAKFLNEGKLVAFPTETVYGVGAIYDNIRAYKKLNKLKRRKPNQPYTLMLGDIKDIKKFAVLDKKTSAFIKKVLPGSITLILKAKNNLPKYLTKDGYIGIRVPSLDITIKLLKEVKKGLLVPSLNRSGDLPLNRIEDIKKEFSNELAAVISVKIKKDKPSTIIKICDKIEVIREGKISSKKLIEVYKSL